MSERIPLPGGYLEGERPEERNTTFHRKITSLEKIPGTRNTYYAALDCGHKVRFIGDPALAHGVALCMACRDGWR